MSTIADFDNIAPARTSGLAVASIVTAILCCLPGMGLISTILGGAALVRISGSQGRLQGRGLAIVALVLGLIGTIGWVLIAAGGNAVAKEAVRSTSAVGQLITSDDLSGVRPVLSAAASSEVTDEQFKDFAARVRKEAGGYKSGPKSMWEWFMSFGSSQQVMEKAAPTMSGRNSGFLPVPVDFDSGKAIVLYQIDDQAQGSSFFPPVKNIGVLAPNGNWVWLRPPGDTGVPQLNTRPAPAKADPAKTEPPTEPAKQPAKEPAKEPAKAEPSAPGK